MIAGGALHALAARGGRSRRRSPWLFALLPPVAFIVQEHLERLVHDGGLPLTAALEPTFLLGLLLQLPFAVLARVVAGLLLDTAERLGRALSPPRRKRPAVAIGNAAELDLCVPRLPRLAAGRSERGPTCTRRDRILTNRGRRPRRIHGG